MNPPASGVAMSDAGVPSSIFLWKVPVYAPYATPEAAAAWKETFGQELHIGYSTTTTTTTSTSTTTTTPVVLTAAAAATKPSPAAADASGFKVPEPRKPKPKTKPSWRIWPRPAAPAAPAAPRTGADDDDDDLFAANPSVSVPIAPPAAGSAGALIEKPTSAPGETAAPIGQNMNSGTLHATLFDPRYIGCSLKELENSETFKRTAVPSPTAADSSLLVVDGKLNTRCRSEKLRDVLLHLNRGILLSHEASREVANTGFALVPLSHWNERDYAVQVLGGYEQYSRDHFDRDPAQWSVDGARQAIQRSLPVGAYTPLTNVVLHNLLVKCFGSPGAEAAAVNTALLAIKAKETFSKEVEIEQFRCAKLVHEPGNRQIGSYLMTDLDLDDDHWPAVSNEWSDPPTAMLMSVITPPIYYREGVNNDVDEDNSHRVVRIWRVRREVELPTPHAEIRYIVCPVTVHRSVRSVMQKHRLFSGADASPNAMRLFDEKANLRPLQAAFYCSWEACEFRMSLHSMFRTAIPQIVRKMGADGDLVDFLKNPDRADKFDQNSYYALPLFVCMALGWGNHELRLVSS
jgi:hypothetical protein